jgi:hypothetical protein
MYRMFKTLPRLATACALVLTLTACNGSPNAPTNTDAAETGSGEAAADGSTLKATAPALQSPIDDFRLDNRLPTMVASNASGRFAGGNFTYEFQLLSDSGSVIRTETRPAGNGSTSWSYPTELERDTPYRWRVRATLDGRNGPWSSTGRFFTVKEKRTPNPPPGEDLPEPNWAAAIIHQVAAEYHEELMDSCQEDGGTWEFMDAVVDALRLEDTRFGYNGKRGNPNDPSHDVIAYNFSSDPDEGTTNVYLFDIIIGHCGPSPFPGWQDKTESTREGGTIGRWISRGRF